MQDLRLLILGGGAVVSEFYIPALYTLGNLQKSVIVEISNSRVETFRKNYQNLTLEQEDFHTFLNNLSYKDKFDAALVALPNCYHEEAIKQALSSGLHVLCEKPLTLSYNTSFQLAEQAKTEKLILAVGMVRRFLPSMTALQESIRKDLAMQSHDSGKKAQVLRRVFHYQRGRLRHGEGGCTRVAAWGQNGVDYFQTVGVPSDRIFVAGNPRIDDFVDRCRRLSRSAARGNLGISLEARVVLFATNPLSWMGIASLSDYLEAIRTVINLVDRLGGEGLNCLLLLKPHRFERADHRLYGIVQACEISRFARYLEDTSLGAAIAATDSVLVFNSTVAVEAALIGKPVGILNLRGWELGIDFVEHGLAVKLCDEFSLEGFVRGDRGAESRQEINVEHFVQHIGSSAERIAEEIMRLATSCT